ncbi:MAG: prepilin-type N-terminal cleavage/methylation domain-containing protein [Rhodobacter sp.]|nr:prepilin-type N-terminal cleavage/methylation domain-containing protein [Rhodobacter sp.]
MDGSLRRHDAGFTLVELMIVVTVLSLLTVSVSLGVNRPRTAQAQDWSRFEALHGRMRAEAVLGRAVLGLALTAEGYSWLRRQGGAWAEVGDGGAWRDGVAVLLPFDPGGRVVFTPGGQSTPVRVRFQAGAQVVICQSDGWAPVTCAGG